MDTHEYKIIGMDCAEEVAAIKHALKPIEDEKNLRFDLLQGKLTIQSKNSTQDLESAIKKSGLKAVPWQQHLESKGTPLPYWQRNAHLLLSITSGSCIVLGVAYFLLTKGIGTLFNSGEHLIYPPLSISLFGIAVVSGGFFVAPKAWHALRSLRADMHLLMSIAVMGALFLGEYLEAATVAFLFSAALLLESWSVGRARRAVESLLDLSPKTARYICPHDGDIMEKPIAEVPVDVTALVRPGERIPLDGEVTKGEGNVNEAPITGESMPVAKAPGDKVYAGSINLDGSLEFKVTHGAKDTQLAHIIHLVNEAQGNRSTSEQWVEKFARYYTPAMILIAIIVAISLPFFSGMTWKDGIYQAMVVLLIACPCALVISTPVSIVSGLARAARNGVLIKGGNFLELPAQLDVIALDKTGTLTTGEPSVSGVYPLNDHTETELLSIASGIETHSAHPLAQAICKYAAQQNAMPKTAEQFKDTPGKGAEARIDGTPYWVGSLRYLEEQGHTNIRDIAPEAAALKQGQSVVFIGTEEHVCGFIAVQDTLRANSVEAYKNLHRAGISEILLLSGDHLDAVQYVAQQVGIDRYESGLLPEDKSRILKELQAQGKKVAMVGDGVNDAPAMATADLSIAMGAAGTDTAIETADIALMTDDLDKIAWLVQHSRRSLRIIKENIALALGLKVIILALVLFGWGALWLAIAADMGASLIVTFNALRLLRD